MRSLMRLFVESRPSIVAGGTQFGRPAGLVLSYMRRFLLLLMAVLGAGALPCHAAPTLYCPPGENLARSLWVAADFDGDQSIDIARLRIRPEGPPTATVDLSARCSEGLHPITSIVHRMAFVLSARDVDADDDQDLILRQAFAGEPLGVWLNDGSGAFSAADPSRFPGAGSPLPGLEKRFKSVYDMAACPSSKFQLSGPILTAVGLPAPDSLRSLAPCPAPAAAGWRGAFRSRPPPPFSR